MSVKTEALDLLRDVLDLKRQYEQLQAGRSEDEIPQDQLDQLINISQQAEAKRDRLRSMGFANYAKAAKNKNASKLGAFIVQKELGITGDTPADSVVTPGQPPGGSGGQVVQTGSGGAGGIADRALDIILAPFEAIGNVFESIFGRIGTFFDRQVDRTDSLLGRFFSLAWKMAPWAVGGFLAVRLLDFDVRLDAGPLDADVGGK